jgi:hypothetical protein
MTEDELIAAARIPGNIPIVLNEVFCIGLAGLIQLALRHPGVKTETPNLYQDGYDFVKAIQTKLGAIDERMALIIEAGWDESNDLTGAEFARYYYNFFAPEDDD